ncbi:MAG: homoserine kinase [Labilithrix sp.]|nr:homoserine kinase [Labilithrix sp.]
MAILTVPTEADLASFVAAYPLASVRTAKGIEAGTVNTSYALELEDGQRWFLRIYEEQDAAGAGREAAVLSHLAAHGVLTPAPLAASDGASMRTLAGKPAAIFPWIDGEMLCQRAVTPDAAAAVGAALARIHVAGHAPGAALDAGRFDPAHLVERCERVASSTDPEARAMAGELREAMTRIAASRRHDVPRGLVHGDLFRDNVLWNVAAADAAKDVSACSSIAALLDFESAHDGPFAYDLAVTILSWSYGSQLDTDVARAVVRGYRAVRELEPGDREVLYDEAVFATLRFTITRITDDAIRVGKRWQRFVERREAVERLGRAGFLEALGL